MIRRSLLLDTVINVIVRTVLVFALFLLFSGHNAPGGGFGAGLVAGTAIVLRYLTVGAEEVELRLASAPEPLMGVGLGLSVLTGVSSWTRGEEFLYSTIFEVEVPVLGLIKTTSALPFDIGVFLVVMGVCLAITTSLGRDRPT